MPRYESTHAGSHLAKVFADGEDITHRLIAWADTDTGEVGFWNLACADPAEPDHTIERFGDLRVDWPEKFLPLG